MQTIQSGQQRLDGAAQTVASGAVADPKALTQALVSAQQAVDEVTAGTKILRAADEMLGQLFNDYA